ncbi:MAG TPA: hypothetical protein IAA45_03770 [Candidatus Blautia gallistercoris]|uniref:Uncharacterized protein n=1 Tax=Candidatus Blautia gallistercoris TaxID=2838490 RepID=A0A9D1WIK4_9FIRM|nr:hypothetical protein [Candidatus Blautia gallistercoris]
MRKRKIFDNWLDCLRPRCDCKNCFPEKIPCCPCCGPQEPQPEPEEDVFASFVVFEVQFANEQSIFWGVGTEDPTGNITLEDNTRIVLEPGYYYIAYSVSAVLDNAGYMQITPFYNGAAHLEYGIYFKTGTASSSACGSGFMIISVPSRTNFTLNYNSSVGNRSGAASITFLKLNRES